MKKMHLLCGLILVSSIMVGVIEAAALTEANNGACATGTYPRFGAATVETAKANWALYCVT